MANVSAGSIPGRSQIENWDIAHLEAAATHWSAMAQQWEAHFTTMHTATLSPGGSVWVGAGSDAAQDRAWTDLVKVRGLANCLYSASSAARNGAGDLVWAKTRALDAIAEAETEGFAVGEDLSVTDRSVNSLMRVSAVRQARAQELVSDIGDQARNLAVIDKGVADKITTAITPLAEVAFDEAPENPAAKRVVQAIDFDQFKEDTPGGEQPPNPPSPPVRGLPPEGVHPPVEGPLTQGPASRPSEAGKGGQSLWDEHGGEWRYFPGDKWHNPHWDYNGHESPSAPWGNVPIGDLPPRIGQPPIISALPPWLQNPAVPGVLGPSQNPLLAPFPGAGMPAPTPSMVPAPGPGLMPHIDLPASSPGGLQTAGGETVVVGGGGLLMLILGAMVLS